VNRLNGDFAGPVICQISTDVYSRDHAELLIPAGSRVLGETKKVNDVGQERRGLRPSPRSQSDRRDCA
jgi:type IV secretion system protein VirB10